MSWEVRVLCEAAGGFEQALVSFLRGAGILVCVIDPARIRAFAKAAGIRAKSDPIDASVIKRFGESIDPPCSPGAGPIQERLRQLTRRRSQLKEAQTLQGNQLALLSDPFLRRQALRLIATLKRQIVSLEKELHELVKSQTSIGDRVKTMEEVSGVGLLTALVLLAEMPELGSPGRGQAAALAGGTMQQAERRLERMSPHQWRTISRPQSPLHGRIGRLASQCRAAPDLPTAQRSRQTTQSRVGGPHAYAYQPSQQPPKKFHFITCLLRPLLQRMSKRARRSNGGTSLRVRAWPPTQIGGTSRMRPLHCRRERKG